MGVEVIWENIGDPVQKGEKIPDWMREVLIDLLKDDRLWLSPDEGDGCDARISRGTGQPARKGADHPGGYHLLQRSGRCDRRAYSAIRVDARIIMPEPTYSTHLLAEVLHASFPPNTYRMNPYCDWSPTSTNWSGR